MQNFNENCNYETILLNTLEEVYPNYLKKKIIKEMSDSGRVINSKRKSKKLKFEDIMDVSELKDEDAKLSHILNYDSENNLYKYIEEFEFNKSYRHSVLFKINNFDIDSIHNLIKEKKLTLYKRESDMKDTIIENNFSKENIVPTIKIYDDIICIKFSYLLDTQTKGANSKPIKYIVLCSLDLSNDVLELRFDKSPQEYRTTKDFYREYINITLGYLNRLLKIDIEHIDFKSLIEYIRTIEDDEICIYAMEMHRNGSKAYLDSMSNADMTIPILGELKNFINENQKLFNSNDETKKIKGELDYFIENIEVTSDLPSVKICWPINDTRIGVKHDYKEEEYSLFIYYDELLHSKEKMDYVREYFMQHYRNLNNQS